MQKVQIAYNFCEKEFHSDEWLNAICLNQSCKQDRLLCCLCLEFHSGHKVTAMKKFLIEYQQQYQKKKNEYIETNTKYNLSKILDSFEEEVKQFKQIINGNFDILLNQIKESINYFQKLETCQDYEKIGKILDKITISEKAQEDIKLLFSSIENLTSNDGFQFQLKEPCPILIKLKERYLSSQQILNDYVEFNQQLSINIKKKVHQLSNQIKHLFSDIQDNEDSDSLGLTQTSISQEEQKEHLQVLKQISQNSNVILTQTD